MTDKIDISDLNELLKNVVKLSGVRIEGDIEIELPSSAQGLSPAFAYAVGHETTQAAIHLLNIARAAGYPVDQMAPAVPRAPEKVEIGELVEARFEVASKEGGNQIEEVTLGATSSDGGSRDYTVNIGGEKALPFYSFDGALPHPVMITMDSFDMPVTLAKAVRMHYEDVMHDPGEWAKKCVREFGAEMVTIHLISTDPTIKDTPAKEAAKTVEEVLQAVKVPIVIGGSGNVDKDPEVLEKAAEAAEGERCLIASANLGMDYKRIALAAKKHGHVILSWTQLDINDQKTLNRHLLKLGIPREDIVIDPTTASLGYGLDYAFTNIERMRIAGLKGDKDLSFPISCGITNAWGGREAWMTGSPIVGDTDWGPREYRGPIWEIITGFALTIAGGDLMMMMHPGAAEALRQVTQTLYGAVEKEVPIEDWLTLEV